ncbi:MAG: ribonuclease HII [Tissierella sp.]|uniref:ribonuclease HII n=1 Tax=Tissierella sp. TaxID=41274 RepID=UPI003F971036
MIDFEDELYSEGYKTIACIDEVGRGCLLGDVVACAIILPKGLKIKEVKDSKKLSSKKRDYLYDIIIEKSIGYGIGRVNSKTIDKINIKESTRLAMKLAVENIVDKCGKPITPDYLLVDAETVYMDIPQAGIIKGDDKSHGIACASIIAKVYRDRLCLNWEKQFPGYNIKQHKGYGTKEHREKLNSLGVTDIHRKSFLKRIIK